MKKLPIGKMVFKNIIQDNFIYVDKTKYLVDLVKSGMPIFLSRPRRFGKSLTTFTFKELFKGSKELFKETYAYTHWNWNTSYPVIRIDMSEASLSTINDIKSALLSLIKNIAEENSITIDEKEIPSIALKELIIKLSRNQKVVILIDEYDAPLLNNLQNRNLNREIKELLRSFYSVIKASEEYIQFLFITGISKFSKVGVFSSMNNLVDITLDERYSSILGYTKDEINHYFREYIDKAKEKHSYSEIEFWDHLKSYYNGYSWDGSNFVYNPFSVLNFFNIFEFRIFWMTSGSPSYIVKYAEENSIDLDNLKNSVVDINFMDEKEIDEASPQSFLTQSGYLTIKGKDEDGDYILDFPNYEVEQSFNNILVKSQYKVDSSDILGIKKALKKALIHNNVEDIIEQFSVIYSSISYIHYDNNKNEHFYHTVMLMFLRACGYKVLTEDLSNKGRSDLSLFWGDQVYIIELKTNGSAKSAIEQIKNKNYAGKYKNRETILIGLKIDFNERNIVESVYEIIKQG